jgi:TRAP-type C4-dicarboxylate transport system permease small subunit
MIPLRVLIVTFLLTVLSFAVSLLLAIIGLVIVGEVAGTKPHLPIAYRQIALPFAMAMALLVLVAATVVEIRRYRQAKALAAIERAS